MESDKKHKSGLRVTNAITILAFIGVFMVSKSDGLEFTKTPQTYAKYPKWNACTNSSMSFEFKTRQSKALLMYTDDNGRYDFVEVQLLSGKVRLRMNIVDGRDGSVDITLGERLNDNKWHMVKIQRNRMETTLYVDAQQDSRVAFGSDFYFGNIATNNFVYFGGLPKNYQSNLKSLSLPSAFFETRFSGSIRNVIYQNCTCMPVRADMVTGMSVSREPKEACEERNGCSAECLCISTDEGPGCQCVDRECSTDTSKYYHLPMDILNGDNLVNPSGLDAKVSGRPITVPGVLGKALKLDGRTQKVKVSGPGHRNECFGDLTLCTEGYTIGLWVKFDKSGSGNGVYMSNGGERVESHGVAMFYRTGRLQWKFRTKTGREWVVTANNMLPRQWYQVMVTWEDKTGLVLYINGEKLAHEDRPSVRVGPTKDGADKMYNDFVIGQSNDGTGSRDLGTMTIDDFQFWSSKMTTSELREKGPIYRYHLSMDQLEYGHLIVPELEPRTRGILQHVPGKIGKAVLIAGSGESIDLGSFSDSCLGNTSLCMYGFTVTFWITFNELRDNSYYMASGVAGFSIFSNGDRLIVNVQNGDRQWRTSTSGIKTDTWYFIEVSWSPTAGLYLYLDQKEMSSQSSSHHQAVKSTSYKNFYIGRANSGMNVEKYGSVTIDHLDLYNADRERLLNIDFIQRGKPQKHYYGFDSMTNGRIHHASTVITTSGKPQLVPGKIGQALRLSGQLQTAIFDHGDGCLGNLDYCKHGALLALWFRPEKFEEGMFYLSSGINGIALAFVDRKVRASAATSTLMWNAMTSELELLTWYYIEVTWHPDTGLKLFANNKLMDKNSYHKAKAGQDTEDLSVMSDKFVLGKDHGEKTGSIYGAATYDEMEFWYGSREYLVAFGYIQRGRPMNYRINMDTILNNGSTLAHPSLSIRLNGKPLLVSGITNNAVHLSGRAQYIDLGVNTDQCLGNLDKCTFGISIFFWVKIDRYDYNMYLLSTGQNGIHISYNNGFLFITLDNKQKSWRISIPKISENVWHLLELSWHPEFGLNFYVDDELQKHVDFITIPYYRAYGSRNFYIGGPNSGDTPGQRFSFANMAVDEMDIWYGRREELLAFGYIIRGNVEYESFSMETASNGVIINPRYHITLERGAKLIPGKVGNAVSLDGRGYVNLGEHMDKCFANVDLCKNGITISMWLNPRTLVNNTYYLSSPTYDLYFENGELKSKFLSNGKSWNVQTKKFRRNQWSNVLLSWQRDNGLELFIDGDRVSRDDRPVDLPQGDEPQPGSLYIGKSAKPGTRSPNVLADEVQYFYANLERLRAQGLYGGEIHEVVPLSQMGSSGVLKLSTRTITLEGGATVTRGQHHNAIALSGKNQYINMGENLTCGGNLDNCRQGFTMRFSAKPDKLQNNMYFLDSYPVSIFYKDGKLYSTVRTSSRTWTVAAPGFKAGEWQVVDVSWHPEIGLTMHVNDDEVGAHKTHGTDVEPVFDWDRTTFFGRAMTVMRDERYADTAVENFEVWNVRRDVLVSDNQNGFGLATTQKPRPNTTPPPPVSNDAGHTTKKGETRSFEGSLISIRDQVGPREG